MRKGLLLVVVLLAVSSLLAAAAYTSAMVSNSGSSSLVVTNEAFLAIEENLDFKDFASIQNGKMVIDFTKAGAFGFQPNSVYQFKDLFFVQNNLDKPIKMGVRFDQVYPGSKNVPVGLHTIETDEPCEGTVPHYGNALLHVNSGSFCCGWNEGRYITLQPGEEVGLDWNFNLGDDTNWRDTTWKLQVFGAPAEELN